MRRRRGQRIICSEEGYKVIPSNLKRGDLYNSKLIVNPAVALSKRLPDHDLSLGLGCITTGGYRYNSLENKLEKIEGWRLDDCKRSRFSIVGGGQNKATEEFLSELVNEDGYHFEPTDEEEMGTEEFNTTGCRIKGSFPLRVVLGSGHHRGKRPDDYTIQFYKHFDDAFMNSLEEYDDKEGKPKYSFLSKFPKALQKEIKDRPFKIFTDGSSTDRFRFCASHKKMGGGNLPLSFVKVEQGHYKVIVQHGQRIDKNNWESESCNTEIFNVFTPASDEYWDEVELLFNRYSTTPGELPVFDYYRGKFEHRIHYKGWYQSRNHTFKSLRELFIMKDETQVASASNDDDYSVQNEEVSNA